MYSRFSRIIRELFYFVILGSALMCGAPTRTLATEPTVEQISKIWQHRKEQFRSARFRWSERRFEAKGWKKNPGQFKSANPQGVTDPPEDLVYEFEWNLTFDKDRWKFGHRLKEQASKSLQGDVPRELVWVFDGGLSRRYSSPWGIREYPEGSEAETRRLLSQERRSELKPVFWACRMPDERLPDYNAKAMRVAAQRSDIAGKPCIPLEIVGPPLDRFVMWIAQGNRT